MRNGCVGQTWPYTYKGFKRPNLVLDAHFEQITFLKKGRGEKGEES